MEPRQRDGRPDSKSVLEVCAEFTSSWEAALKSGRDLPSVDPFLSRVSLADRSELQQELNEIHQAYSQRFLQGVWMGATIDQKANTPCPESNATVDSTERDSGIHDAASVPDSGATMEHVSSASVSGGGTLNGPGLPNAAFPVEEREQASGKIKFAHVPGYEIVGELGRGGMGVVYKARQVGLNRWVALKMVLAAAHASQHQLNRFLTEAKAVADLQHPNIVQIYENGSHDGLPFFSLEFVGGGSLDAKVHRKAQPPREAAHMVETLAQAMQYAHERGVIHRDLKPANILLTTDGIPKITDFGLAKRLAEDSGQTKSGTLMGTPNYMAPEQARGEIQLVGPLSDVYTLGAILYELLTGRPPFQGPTVLETVKQVTNDEPVPPSRLQPQVPHDLETICLKCLQKDMGKRYESARALAEDLRRFLSDEPILARPVSNWERLGRWCRRNPRVAVLVGTVALLLIVVAGGSLAFAYRLSEEKKRTEEQSELATRIAGLEKDARDEADQNAKLAERRAEEARKAQALASEQAKLALEIVYDVVTKTNEKLQPIAQLGSLRKELLQLAMQKLEHISKDAVDSGKADRTMGIALQNMGKFYEQWGETEKQTEVIESSLKIFNRLIAEQPEDELNKFNATISHDSLGEIGRENWPNPDKIRFHYDQSLEMRKELVANQRSVTPGPYPRLRLLAIAYLNWAVLALELGDPGKSLQHAQQALKYTKEAYAADKTKDYHYREMLSSVYLTMGKASFRLGETSNARRFLQNSLMLRQEWVKANELDDYAKKELGRTLEAFGDMETESRHYQEALDYYQKALTVFKELLQKDPNVPTELQWYRSNVEYRLGTIYQQLNDGKAAQEHFLACAKTREGLFKSDPKNAQRKVELMLVEARLGKHREAAKMAQELVDFAPQHPGKLFAAACGFALCNSSAVPQGQSANADDEAIKHSYADKALATLGQAIRYGYRDVQALQTSPDLASLRSSDDYKRLISQIPRQQAAKED
jgi:serine/threonine-protein kinase